MAENLKVKIGADTSQFNAGMKDVRKGLKDLDSVGSGALSSLGAALGINVGQIQKIQSALVGAASGFIKMGRDGSSALSSATIAAAKLGAGIAGLGIAGAVLAFKELNREAANFETRLQGVNLAASAKAYRETYRQALDDVTGAGEKTANWMETFKSNWSRDWSNLMHPFASDTERREADMKAQKSAELAGEYVDLMRERRDLGIEIQKIDNQILEQQNTFRDTSKSVAERKEAEAKITELINTKYAKQEDLQKRIANNISLSNYLTSSSEEELDKQADAQRAVLALEGQRQQELNTLLRYSNSLNKSMAGQASSAKETEEATRLTLEAALQLAQVENAKKELDTHNEAMMARAHNQLSGNISEIDGSALTAQAETLTIPAIIKPVVDTEAAEQAVIGLSDIVESGVSEMADAFGSLIGNLINGEDAWSGFAQAGIEAVANMLATVGQAFIAEGVGVEAAKLALTTGGGVGAIAAGAAMVALAATMKTTMANAASNWGGATASSSVASSSYSSGSSLALGDISKSIEVKVTGTLTGEGSKLKAVLNNEDRRNSVTT